MDNFVAELKNNINIDSENSKETKARRFREILYYISKSNSEIRIIEECSEDGDFKFEIPMRSIGITYDLYIKYKKEICSDFMANFLGELLIRENLNRLAKILTNIDPGLYMSVVDKWDHRQFGMEIMKDCFVFTFHISLLQSILLEDIKKLVRH